MHISYQEKTQILIAHQKENLDMTKKIPLAARKSEAGH